MPTRVPSQHPWHGVHPQPQLLSQVQTVDQPQLQREAFAKEFDDIEAEVKVRELWLRRWKMRLKNMFADDIDIEETFDFSTGEVDEEKK